MADTGTAGIRKEGLIVVIAMDGSEYSDYALKCKFNLLYLFIDTEYIGSQSICLSFINA